MKFRFQRKYFSIPYIIFLCAFVLIPIILIIYYAFSDTSGALSLEAAKNFFQDTAKLEVILVSFFISIQTTLICLLLGYPLAYLLANKKSNQKKSNLKKSQLELFSSTMLSMNLYPKEKQLSVIKNLLESKNTSGNANVPNNPEDAIKNQNVNPDVKRNQQDSSDQVSNSPLKDL